MYLRIEGVQGASRHRDFRGCIDVISYSWGIARKTSPPGTSPGHVTSGNALTMVKTVAVDSVALMNLCANGTIIPSAQLSIVPAVSRREAQHKYADVTLFGLVIRSIATAGAVGDDGIRETLDVRFRKMRFEYFLPTSADAVVANKPTESRLFECDFVTQTSSCT